MRRLVIVQENGVEFGDKKWIYLMEIAMCVCVCEREYYAGFVIHFMTLFYFFLLYFNLSFVVVRARAFICLSLCVFDTH